MKKIVYIGNNLLKHSNYKTSYQILSELLEKEGFRVVRASDKKNIFLRMADMIYTVWKHRDAGYILIDTFSTKNFYYAWIISQMARIMNIPYIPILHGGNLPQRLKKSPVLSNMIFRNAYVNVAPSGYLKKVFDESGYQTTYIPNTIPIDRYPFKKRKTFGPELLWVRSFAKHYLPGNAVKVLHHLSQTYPNARLCMVGPDKDGTLDKVKQLVKQYQLEDKVEFTGALSKEEWRKKSEAYDFFINTTAVDNTPISVMEAMALGLVVVSTNAGGLTFLLEHGKDSILTDVNKPEQMARAIRELIQNPGKAQTLAGNARKKAGSFDWENVKKLWHQWLK